MYCRLIAAGTVMLTAGAGGATAAAQSAPSDPCAPHYTVYIDNSAVVQPREVASECLRPEVVQAAAALGMARYNPPTVKAVTTIQWIAQGALAPPGNPLAAPHTVARVVLGISYAVPAIRLQFEGTAADGREVRDILVASGSHAWNETAPGVGATRAPAGALEERVPLIWLTPYGAIWAAIDADPTRVQVSQSSGRTVIAASFDGMRVRTTLGADRRPETVEVEAKAGTYRARYAGYFDPDHYGVFTPRTIDWTLNGRPLATLSVIDCRSQPPTGPGEPPCGFRANPYVVFPVPAAIRDTSSR